MSATTEKPWLSKQEAAEYAGVSHRTVRRWLESGELRYYKLGEGPKARVRIKVSDLDALIESNPGEWNPGGVVIEPTDGE